VRRAALLLLLVLPVAGLALRLARVHPAGTPAGSGVRFADRGETGGAGFERALEPRPFVLPEDHGPHFGFQTEWWYYTGNLQDADGARFGFQLTFFRRGLSPGPPPEGPGLATNQIYFAHFAVTDVAAGRHVADERFARGAGELAGATVEPLRVWLEDWEAVGTAPDGSALRLAAKGERASLELRLRALRPLVGHGDRGLSPKSAAPGNASYYASYTRLSAEGAIGTDGAERPVTGEAWFDHEWSTSALGPGAIGWDWFSLQLDDGRELMLFQIRRDGGGLEPVSGGTLVQPDGSTRRLALADVRLEVLDHWTSPETGARYPAAWRLGIPSAGLDLEVRPVLADQEMRTSFVYWEGAVDVAGSPGGRGYVELTGYARSMQGVF